MKAALQREQAREKNVNKSPWRLLCLAVVVCKSENHVFPFVLPSGAFELWLFEKSHQRLCVWALYHNFPRLNNTRLPGILFPQLPSTWGASVSKEVPLSGKRGIATKRVDERLSLLSLRFLSLSPLPPKKLFFFFFFRVSPFYLF